MVKRSVTTGLVAAAAVIAAGATAHALQPPPQAYPPGTPYTPYPRNIAAPNSTGQNLTAPAYQIPPTPPQPLRRDQISAILATLKDAESHGFRAGEFYPENLDAQVYASDPTFRSQGEQILRANIIRYARAQHGLRITNWPKNWAMKPPPYDAENDFNLAVKEDRVSQWIDGLAPPFDQSSIIDIAPINQLGG